MTTDAACAVTDGSVTLTDECYWRHACWSDIDHREHDRQRLLLTTPPRCRCGVPSMGCLLP